MEYTDYLGIGMCPSSEISLQSGHFLIHDLSTGCNKSNTAGVTSGGGIAYTSEAPELTPSF
jgi:hypothetical protein